MLVYLLKSGVCLFIFFGFYKLLLEKESFHAFKRFYLLATLVLSFSIPFITFTEYIEIAPQIVPEYYPEFSNNYIETPITVEKTNYIPFILWSIYGLGVLLFGLHFIKNLNQLVYKIKHNTKVKDNKFTKVLLQDIITPHTFFSFIFLNKNKFETQQIPREVLLHEETHAIQKHSIDVLFIELLQILFWFNPIIYLIKYSIKLNHEFLADQAVLNKGVLPSKYQETLLAFSSNATEPQLSNAINYSLIKKRFTVMKTKTSKRTFWLRSFILLPLLAILIYGFSEKVIIQKVSEELNTTNPLSSKKEPTLEISYNPDIFKLNGKDTSLSRLKEDFAIETNHKESDLRIAIKGGINMSLIEKIMTELKGNLIKINLDEEAFIVEDRFTSEASNSKPKKNSEVEIISSKKQKKDSLINDVLILINEKNQILLNNKLTNIDKLLNDINKLNPNLTADQKRRFLYGNIKHQTITSKGLIKKVQDILRDANIGSYSTENVQISEKSELKKDFPGFPLMNSENLSKEDRILYKHQINKYKEWLRINNPNRKLEETEKGYVIKDANGKITFSTDPTIEAEPLELKKDSPWKITSVVTEVTFEESVDDNTQQKATSEEITEYNKLAKQYNAQPENKRIIKLEDLKRLEFIYGKMSKEQKVNAEPFPNCPPPPPPPPGVKDLEYFENPSEELKKSYKDYTKLAVAYSEAVQLYFKDKKGYISDLTLQYDNVMKLYKDYEKIASKEKIAIPPDIPNPPKVQKNPPPPPAPKNPLDHVIDMAKKGAEFYYEGKTISSDEAIKLMKLNSSHKIYTTESKSKKPKVYISK